MNRKYRRLPKRFLKSKKPKYYNLLIKKQQKETENWDEIVEEIKETILKKVTKNTTQELIELRDYCNEKLNEDNDTKVNRFVNHFKQRLTVALENLNVYSYQTNGDKFDGSIHQAFRSIQTKKKDENYMISKSLKDGYYTFYETDNIQKKKILQYEIVEVYIYDKGVNKK